MTPDERRKLRHGIVLGSLTLTTILGFMALLCIGAVNIPLEKIWEIITGDADPSRTESIIIMQSRLPMSIAALLAGASLSIAGLLLQTTFRNPLAGPSILGVSSGASLGVAIITLGASYLSLSGYNSGWMAITGALCGAAVVMCVLLLLSNILKNPVMLLIVGVMVSYLASSIISLLNYVAPSEDVKSFIVWGLGSFSSVRVSQLPILASSVCISLLGACLLAKPLNALLLGERYAASMGYSLKSLRTALMVISGLLTALITAFCGPIGFIGLIVPHIARILTGSSNHLILIPATILAGTSLMLICALCTVIPTSSGVIPVNVITPIIGVPMILYIILRRKNLKYFN